MDDLAEKWTPKPPKSFFGKKDTVLRSGREAKAEFRYRGNSTCAPKCDHRGKGKTLRAHRRKQNIPTQGKK